MVTKNTNIYPAIFGISWTTFTVSFMIFSAIGGSPTVTPGVIDRPRQGLISVHLYAWYSAWAAIAFGIVSLLVMMMAGLAILLHDGGFRGMRRSHDSAPPSRRTLYSIQAMVISTILLVVMSALYHSSIRTAVDRLMMANAVSSSPAPTPK